MIESVAPCKPKMRPPEQRESCRIVRTWERAKCYQVYNQRTPKRLLMSCQMLPCNYPISARTGSHKCAIGHRIGHESENRTTIVSQASIDVSLARQTKSWIEILKSFPSGVPKWRRHSIHLMARCHQPIWQLYEPAAKLLTIPERATRG